MVKYNPHAPQALGFEWVGIHSEPYVSDTTEEVGYSFSLPTAATIVSGGIIVSSVPAAATTNVDDPIFIYRAGTEDKTGPVRSIIIPVRSTLVSGDCPAPKNTSSLLNPSDGSFFGICTTDISPQTYALMFFDVSSYASVLSGKRIVDVALLYTAVGTFEQLSGVFVELRRPATSVGSFVTYVYGLEGERFPGDTVLHRASFGHMNTIWSATGPNARVYPFRYNELALSDWCVVFNNSGDPTASLVQLGYVALEVRYCDENRVGYGSARIRSNTSPYHTGLQLSQLKDTNYNDGVALAAGNYTVTTMHHDEGFTGTTALNFDASASPPTMAAIRQFYEIPGVTGVRVQQTTTIDGVFTSSSSNVLPPIALYATSGAITGTHTYSEQVAGPVYDAITVQQEIDQSEAPSTAANFTQARFYARRFGATTSPLTLTGIDDVDTPTASITPTEFDALTEIIDGWREVTLRLNVPVSYVTATTEPRWEWSAPGETAGGRWEILGTSVPFNAVTGTFGTARVSYNDYESTTVNGGNVLSTWRAPNSPTMTSDPAVDFVIILSQDPPTVSGLAVTEQTQVLTSFTDACDVSPECVPTGLTYHHVSWSTHPNVACDTFSRVVVDDWGTADTGQVWSVVLGAATEFAVSGGVATQSHSVTNFFRQVTLNASMLDVEQMIDVSTPVLLTGGALVVGTLARYQDTANYYWLRVEFDKDSTDIVLKIVKRIANVETQLAVLDPVPGLTYTVNTPLRLRTRVLGDRLFAKVWNASMSEPFGWHLTAVDSSITVTGLVGVQSWLVGGNTNTLPVTTSIDNFTATAVELVDQTYELQRQDDVDVDWHAIATSTSLCVSSFDDYEARVGVESRYRIRQVNALDFAGAWSNEVGNTLTAPGVTGTAGVGTLIFTTNEKPLGNLAHTMSWSSGVDETFSFSEAESRQLSNLYGRDFPIAIRPLERGGERFSRMLLLQATAIPLPSMGNMRGLRDLAWSDVSYICVRDELGNRWFANVNVPDGSVRRNRTLYLARVDITEIASVPSVVTMSG